MKLPNADRADIDLNKLTGYSLNSRHDDGKHKAYVFKRVLGLTIDDAEWLLQRIAEILSTDHEAIPDKLDRHGQRYHVDFELRTDVGEATIRTVWMIRAGETHPRLVSCYVK